MKNIKKNEHLLKQVVEKTMPIAQVLYLQYQPLFLFDNTTSHSVFSMNDFQVDRMNKKSGGQQKFLRNE